MSPAAACATEGDLVLVALTHACFTVGTLMLGLWWMLRGMSRGRTR